MKGLLSTTLAIALLPLALPGDANASDLNVFLGGGLGSASVGTSGASSDPGASTSVLMLRAGVRLNDILSLEMRTGVAPGTSNANDVEAKNIVAFYAKPEIAISDRLLLNAAIGYGGVRYETANGGHTKGSSLSYSIGGEYFFTENASVTFDYARANEEKTTNADTIVIGLDYNFTL